MAIKPRSEQEWAEFFESDEFDVSAFQGSPNGKTKGKNTKPKPDLGLDNEKAVDELIRKLS